VTRAGIDLSFLCMREWQIFVGDNDKTGSLVAAGQSE
jgi:hypothetical protein